MKENDPSPYFALVDKDYEGGVRLSHIFRYCDYAIPVIDTLMKSNLVYGQRYLFEDDMLLVYIGQSVSKRVIEGIKQHSIRPPLNSELLHEQIRRYD